MKIKYKIFFAIPYLIAYFLLFLNAGKMTYYTDEKDEKTRNVSIYKSGNKTHFLTDSIHTVNASSNTMMIK